MAVLTPSRLLTRLAFAELINMGTIRVLLLLVERLHKSSNTLGIGAEIADAYPRY